MERMWILSSTMWCSLSMYMMPTETGCAKASPVRPSKSVRLPFSSTPACLSSSLILHFRRGRERRNDGLVAEHFRREPEVHFEYLAEVHTGRHRQPRGVGNPPIGPRPKWYRPLSLAPACRAGILPYWHLACTRARAVLH